MSFGLFLGFGSVLLFVYSLDWWGTWHRHSNTFLRGERSFLSKKCSKTSIVSRWPRKRKSPLLLEKESYRQILQRKEEHFFFVRYCTFSLSLSLSLSTRVVVLHLHSSKKSCSFLRHIEYLGSLETTILIDLPFTAWILGKEKVPFPRSWVCLSPILYVRVCRLGHHSLQKQDTQT
jgi:hypothetical protein